MWLAFFAVSPLAALSQSNDIRYLAVKGRADVQVPVDYLRLVLESPR